MNFFTSPQDLTDWVRKNASWQKAQQRLNQALGAAAQSVEQDLTETLPAIHAKGDPIAAKGLFRVLVNNNLTETKEPAMKQQAVGKQSMNKVAFYRHDPTHINMRTRMCPKLPRSTGQIVSTAICREHCIDSVYFDDDSDGVYCLETLWRKHIADKFSREWSDKKTGALVGGYINNRFHVFPTAGTPANPDVPRDGGNNMQLKPWERSRQPKPHEWSIERRMQEQREAGSTSSITTHPLNETNLKTASMITGDNLVCSVCGRNEPHGNGMQGYGDGRDLICEVCASAPDKKKCTYCENIFEIDDLNPEGYCAQCLGTMTTSHEKDQYAQVTAKSAHKIITAQVRSGNFIRLANAASKIPDDAKAYQVFAESVELKLAGIPNDEAALQLANEYKMPITAVVAIQSGALRKLASHETDVYAMQKTAQVLGETVAPAVALCTTCQKSNSTLPCAICKQPTCAVCKDMTKTEVHTCQRCGTVVDSDAADLGLEPSAPK